MVYGIWYMVYGIWYLVYGIWDASQFYKVPSSVFAPSSSSLGYVISNESLQIFSSSNARAISKAVLFSILACEGQDLQALTVPPLNLT